MELKAKYQYTYFIKPFIIEKSQYSRYLLDLLNNKNCKLKIFEKEKDLNLYSYFLPNIREYFFPTFSFNKNQISELEENKNDINAIMLSKLHCNIFEYILEQKVQGKVNEENGIFFNIDKIEIVCLDTGICFLIIKTNVENSDKFADILNFNYKLKDINTDYKQLKDYNNIKVQTDTFGNMDEFSEFIDNITGVNNSSKLKDIDLYNKRFFVYTYTCIDQENWNNEDDFKNIENEFIKYSNVLSNNSTLEFNNNEFENSFQTIKPFKYAKFGFTKQSASLITSSADINNYTKILFEYENEYLYTLLIPLYERIYLKKLENNFKEKESLEEFSKFTEELWTHEITNSLTGTMFFNKWKEVFELRDIYNQIKNKYEVTYKELKVDNNAKTNRVIAMALAVSLVLNVINFIVLLRLL